MRLFGKHGSEAREKSGTLLFFATDLHGSEVCFRKFLNAGKFYGATHLIIGGDITGKSLVPIRHSNGRWSARLGDRDHICTTERELADLQQAVRDSGQYPLVGDPDELLALADEGYRARVFTRAVVEGMKRWMDLADQRLQGTRIQCFVTPGNDDFWEVDAVIQGSQTVQFVEGRCVSLDERHEMVTTGYSNLTPWKTEREVSEEELERRLEAMWANVRDPENALAVIHVPPLGTALDVAPELGPDLNLKMSIGGLKMTHVGSSAVRKWIEDRQPLCGLHGHVHESQAAERLGRTLCLNPGSDYASGALFGALVALGDRRVTSDQFVSG